MAIQSINIKGMKFVPADVSIASGDTVRWVNQSPMVHTVTADDARFDSGSLGKGDSFDYVVQGQPGDATPYHCEFHPAMTGVVRIAPAPTASYSPDMGKTFWYNFDLRTLYNAQFMQNVVRVSGAGIVQDVYAATRSNGTYPNAFLAPHLTKRAEWQEIADVQVQSITDFLSNLDNVQAALEDFGQGVLLSDHQDRIDAGDRVHMMDTGGSHPIGFHRWHASIRLIQLLGIGDPAWWEELDKRLALGWAVQSHARPVQGNVANAPISAGDLQTMRQAWMPMSPQSRDAQFDRVPVPGYHPSPLAP